MWQPIETAPKDGTIVRVKNDQMDHPVLAKVGTYERWGKKYPREWLLVKDEGERFMPMQPGTLIIPTHWQPVKPNPTQERP